MRMRKTGFDPSDLVQGYMSLPHLPWEQVPQMLPAAPMALQSVRSGVRAATHPVLSAAAPMAGQMAENARHGFRSFHSKLFNALNKGRMSRALRKAVKLGGLQGLELRIIQDDRAISVTAEVADDPGSRRRGLMFRDKLGDGTGMLFVFPTKAVRGFWMKNVVIPLDILFIRDDTVLRIKESAVPMSEKSISSGTPVDSVLEVPGGFCARHGIGPGARIEVAGG